MNLNTQKPSTIYTILKKRLSKFKLNFFKNGFNNSQIFRVIELECMRHEISMPEPKSAGELY
jgi:hypothetical protein